METDDRIKQVRITICRVQPVVRSVQENISVTECNLTWSWYRAESFHITPTSSLLLLVTIVVFVEFSLKQKKSVQGIQAIQQELQILSSPLILCPYLTYSNDGPLRVFNICSNQSIQNCMKILGQLHVYSGNSFQKPFLQRQRHLQQTHANTSMTKCCSCTTGAVSAVCSTFSLTDMIYLASERPV